MTISWEDVARFRERGQLFKHSKSSNIAYTDGIKWLVDGLGAYWLVNRIVAAQNRATVKAADFQIWRLDVFRDKRGMLTCYNKEANKVLVEQIGHTDFPIAEVTIYCVEATIMLADEYLE